VQHPLPKLSTGLPPRTINKVWLHNWTVTTYHKVT